MIDFYTWETPNGFKVAIMLEETGLSYELHPINIRQQEQFTPDYKAINPNSKIPAIIDREGPQGKPLSLFESGAILIYLAQKSGRFLATDPAEQIHTIQWVMFQMAGVGPMFGQLNHFNRAAPEKIPYAISRYQTEVKRLFNVINTHLAGKTYFVKEYSIADMALFPWLRIHERLGVTIADFPHVAAWLDRIGGRPAVQRGLTLL